MGTGLNAEYLNSAISGGGAAELESVTGQRGEQQKIRQIGRQLMGIQWNKGLTIAPLELVCTWRRTQY